MMNHHLDGCPDLETLAAYLDGKLADADRDRVTEHVASCETCYFVFKEAAQTHSDAEIRTATATATSNRWWTAKRVIWSSTAAALATAAMVWLAVSGNWFRASESASLQALVAAVGNERTIEARLTGGFAYGPLRGAVRSGESPAQTGSPDVRIAAAQIEKEALGRRTPQARRMLGLAYLATGDLGRAVTALEAAADESAPDAQVLSDLAAAYIARAGRASQSQDLTKALAAADRAVKANPKLAEAWFNRACALERLSLADEARAAWGDYLKIDDGSGWADEARQRLRDLR